MEIVNVDPKLLRPAEYNPRRMTKSQVEDLTESIRKFGLVDPIVVNSHPGRENVVVGGHQRLKIAILEGFEVIPVVYVNLDEKSEKELNLRLNKNLGEWDWDLLANFDVSELEGVGFAKDEIERALDISLSEDDFDADKEYNKIESPITQKGDLYQLGNHKLLCGDSSNEENLKKLLQDQKIDMIFTDPPYNVNYDYTITYAKERVRKKPFKAFDDNRSDKEFSSFIEKVFKNAFVYLKENGVFYCWHASKTDKLFREGIENAGGHISLTIFWLKNSCSFSRGLDYLWAIEPCFYGWKKGKKHFVNKKVKMDMKNIETLDINDFELLVNVWYEKRDKITSYGHPTQKPIRLAERALKKNTLSGQNVLDLFGGSGSTLIACEQGNRNAFLMEIDPKYVQVIINRWEKFTKQKAVKLN